MISAWSRFFSLSASHAAFGDDPPLAIRPAHDTAEALARNRCRMRGDGAAVAVWCGDADGWTPARDMPPQTLLFRIDAADPALPGATGPDWRGELTPGATVVFSGGGAGVAMAVRGPAFEHRFSAPVEADLSVVAAVSGAEVWSQASAGFARRFCDVSLGDASEGRYVLKAGGREELAFLMLRDGAAPFAALEVDAAAAVAARFGGRDDPPAYKVVFAPRALPWVYRVFASPAADLTGAAISGAAFSAGREVQARGRAAVVFVSDAPLPIGAPVTPVLKPGSGGFASLRLPVASPGLFGRHDGRDAFVMNVYL